MQQLSLKVIQQVAHWDFKTPNTWSIPKLEKQCTLGNVWGVLEEDTLMSFCVIAKCSIELEIYFVASNPANAKKGWAFKILSEICTWAKKDAVEEVFLEVETTNQRAIDLYLGLAFEKIGLRQNYYGATRHALLLKKVL